MILPDVVNLLVQDIAGIVYVETALAQGQHSVPGKLVAAIWADLFLIIVIFEVLQGGLIKLFVAIQVIEAVSFVAAITRRTLYASTVGLEDGGVEGMRGGQDLIEMVEKQLKKRNGGGRGGGGGGRHK